MPGDADDVLSQLAEEFSERLRAGEPADVDEYAARYPHLAERIRALFPTLVLLRDCAPQGGGDSKGSLSPGTCLGEYEILEEIGRGGMGVVYAAVHSTLRKRVALKCLPDSWANAGDEVRERFFREARTAASLHHTNIVPVFDIGEDRGVPYFAMQLVDGRGLDAVINDLRQPGRSKLPPEAERFEDAGRGERSRDATRTLCRWAADLGAQGAEALDHAHQRGIIHRDVKPSNLMIDRQGNLWITDLGLARGVNDPALTQTGALLGTPRYMSPEQAAGPVDSIDRRTDVYSLGVTLYELITGERAFESETTAGLIQKIALEEPVRPRRHAPSIPADLETVILKAMAKRPRDRYASAGELATDLRRFLRGEPVLARPVGPLGRTIRWCRRNPQLALVTFAAAAVILAVCGVHYVRVRMETAQTESALTQARASLSKLFLEKYERALEEKALQRAAVYAAAALDAKDDPLARGRLYTARARARAFLERVIPTPHLSIDSLAFSSDGRRLAGAAAESGCVVWSMDDGSRRVVHYGLAHGAVTFDASEGCAAVGLGQPEGTIESRDLLAGRSVSSRSIGEALTEVHTRALSRDGRRFAVATQDSVLLWDLGEATPQALPQPASQPRRLDVPAGNQVTALAFDPASETIAYSYPGEVGLWDPETGVRRRLRASDSVGAASILSCLAFTPQGRFLIGGGFGALPIWHASTGSRVTFHEKGHKVSSLACSPDGKLLASGDTSGAVLIWSFRLRRVVLRLNGHGEPITAIAFTGDGQRMATASAYGAIRIWNLAPFRKTWWERLGAHGEAFSPDGSRVVTKAVDGTLVLWDGENGSEITKLYAGPGDSFKLTTGPEATPGYVFAAFSPAGTRLLSARDRMGLRLHDGRSGDELATIDFGEGGGAIATVFSPDGTRFALGRGRLVELRAAESGALEHSFRLPRGALRNVSFRPDGTLLGMATEQEITLGDPRGGRVVGRLESRGYGAMAFSPDGALLAHAVYRAGPKDYLVRVAEVPSGRILQEFQGPATMITDFAFVDGGRLLVATRDVGTDIRVFHSRRGHRGSRRSCHEGRPVRTLRPSRLFRDARCSTRTAAR